MLNSSKQATLISGRKTTHYYGIRTTGFDSKDKNYKCENFFRDQDIWRGISFFVISSFAGEKKTKDKTSGTVKVFFSGAIYE